MVHESLIEGNHLMWETADKRYNTLKVISSDKSPETVVIEISN